MNRAQLHALATTCERYVPDVEPEDPALATSLAFVSLRLRRIADRAGGPPPRLGARHLDVLRLAAEDLTDREIAERLCLSVETVRTHMRNLRAILGVRTRTGATTIALRSGWI